MDFRFSAYGIGQRRQPNDASSFAPIRSGGGGGGGGGNGNGSGGGSGGGAVNDNFRGPQSLNYGRSDGFNNGNNGFNNHRYSDIDNNKFGSMQTSNFGGGFSNFSNQNNNQRFTNPSRGLDHAGAPPIKSNFDSNFRGTTQQNQTSSLSSSTFMGRSYDQRFNMNDNNSRNGNVNNSDLMSDNFCGQQQQQQQLQVGSNIGLGRSISDLNFNNGNNNSSNNKNSGNNTENNQRFYNNDRNIDSFRRVDSFNDNFRGQDSNHMSRTGSNFKFANERPAPAFVRSNNTANFGNFNERGFDGDFRGSQPKDFPMKNNGNNNHNNNNQAFYSNSQTGNNHLQNNYRSQNNAVPSGDAMAVLETVNALMKQQSHWQVGNSNYGFGQGKSNGGGNRNNRSFDNNAGSNNPNTAPIGNRPQQLPNSARGPRHVNNVSNNKPQPPVSQRKPPAGFNKFPANKPQNHQQQQQQKPIVKNDTNPKNQAAVVKNGNTGKPKPKPAQALPKANADATNTQPKGNSNSNNNSKQLEVKKEDAEANAKGQKRAADIVAVPLSKADIKRRKLSIKRGFLLGGFKLPYINHQKVALPQTEDKSYAIMFFEQAPNYSTSGEELDDEAMAENQDFEQDGKNAGRTLVKRIRKRLHYEWSIREEADKYKCWQTWWTDYKWCESAIKEQLDTFGSINLRNCFIPDFPRLTTEQVVDVIVKQAAFGLEKNSDNYYNNMKSIFTLMNVTFLENLKMPNSEKVQDMIRAVPNDFWSYKMRSMVYLWAQYLKISKTAEPSTETGAKELQAIARDWKNPLFHWIAKQAFDELKAISEVEWPEHKEAYANIESAVPTS